MIYNDTQNIERISKMLPKLIMIIPCYNEQEVLPITSKLFLDKLTQLTDEKKISEQSRIMFVNDGSRDNTWDIIKKLAETDSRFMGISQSRNRGHQNAVLAGLMEAKDNCDITISIDCDGQDDINAMDKMVEEYLGGCEVVYGVRSKRDTDTFFNQLLPRRFLSHGARQPHILPQSASTRFLSKRAPIAYSRLKAR